MPRPKPRERERVTEARLAEVALAYLNRVPASKRALARKLEQWVRTRGEPPDVEAARPAIAALLIRYEASRLLDDARLAEGLVASLRARGVSRRAIEQRLAARGLEASAVDSALSGERGDQRAAELDAARALVRRRRLGPHRPEEQRAPSRRRDLAALARAGFDFDTASQALGGRREDEF